MSLLDIDIPFNGGNAQNISESYLWNSQGSAFVWVGGNNNNKFISIRFQSGPDFYHTHVFEVDDIKSSTPTFSDLGGLTRPTSDISNSNHRSHNVRMRRLNSTTAYMKIFTGYRSSTHFIVEMDESDNSVSVTNIDDQVGEALTKGGCFGYGSYDGNLRGRGLYQQFMYSVKENCIVMYSSYDSEYVTTPTSNGSRQYRSGFSQIDWDPVNKTVTVTDILTGTGLSSHTNFGRLPQFKGDHYVIDAYDANNVSVRTSPYAPVISGFTAQVGIQGGSNYDMPANWESQGNNGWFNVTHSRDGDSIHFALMGQHASNTSSWAHDANSNSSVYQYYVITYKKSTNTWHTTSRRSNTSSNITSNEQFCWLPLNTVSSKSMIDDSRFYDDQQHCKTWISVGAYEIIVNGAEGGGKLGINPSNFSGPNINDEISLGGVSESIQTMWLNDDHFMVIWAEDLHSNMIQLHSDSHQIGYSIVKYIDENQVEVVSADYITSSDLNSSSIPYFEPSTLFVKMDDFTLFSDKFARPVTISAPE